MAVTNSARLSFYSNLPGEIVRLSIPRARLTTTSQEAEEAMNAIIGNGAVVTNNGIPTSIHGAKIVTTGRIQIV